MSEERVSALNINGKFAKTFANYSAQNLDIAISRVQSDFEAYCTENKHTIVDFSIVSVQSLILERMGGLITYWHTMTIVFTGFERVGEQ